GGVTDQVFAVWVNSNNLDGPAARQRAWEMIGLYNEQLAKYPDDLGLALTVADSDRHRAEGRIATWLFLEGGQMIDSSIENLHEFYDAGVRGMTLTWMNNIP